MNKKILSLAIIAGALLMGGCAVDNEKTQFHGLGLTYQSNVKQLANGDYFTETEAAPAAGRIPGAVGSVNKNATDFCKAQNKSMKEVKMERDSHAR